MIALGVTAAGFRLNSLIQDWHFSTLLPLVLQKFNNDGLPLS